MKMLLFGMPGAGKDTQGTRLSDTLNIPHYTTGGILRKAAETDKELDAFLRTGQLVDDITMAKIIENLIKSEKDFILNGYPRNIEQAKFLSGLTQIDMVIFLQLSEATAITRLLERERSDDTLETIKERIAIFQKTSKSILDFYDNKVIYIDGEGDSKDITIKILSKVCRFLEPQR